jgi:hypothetical protein
MENLTAQVYLVSRLRKLETAHPFGYSSEGVLAEARDFGTVFKDIYRTLASSTPL